MKQIHINVLTLIVFAFPICGMERVQLETIAQAAFIVGALELVENFSATHTDADVSIPLTDLQMQEIIDIQDQTYDLMRNINIQTQGVAKYHLVSIAYFDEQWRPITDVERNDVILYEIKYDEYYKVFGKNLIVIPKDHISAYSKIIPCRLKAGKDSGDRVIKSIRRLKAKQQQQVTVATNSTACRCIVQ